MMFTKMSFTCIFVSLQGIMLVYDITNDKSFENIKNWIRNIEEVSMRKCTVMAFHQVGEMHSYRAGY